MRFRKNEAGDWKIVVRFGPEGLQRRHLGHVEGTKVNGKVYAGVYLNYNSPSQVWRYDFFGSVRAAKTWVKDQIAAAS